MPGALLVLLGLLGYSIGMPGMTISGVTFDVHTRLFASLAILCGYQSILFVMFTKAFAIGEGLMPEDQRLTRFFATVKLELGLLIASAVLLIGLVLLLVAVNQWRSVNFGNLDYFSNLAFGDPGRDVYSSWFSNLSVELVCQHLGDGPQMSMIERVYQR
jgi:hypothetical protein